MSEPGKAMMGTVVAGGPDRAHKAATLTVVQPAPATGLRTGTDKLPILNHVVGHGPQGGLPQHDLYGSQGRLARDHQRLPGGS